MEKIIGNVRILETDDNTKLHLCDNGMLISSIYETGKSDIYKSVPVHAYVTIPYDESNYFYNKIESGWYYNNSPAIRKIVEVKEDDIKGLASVISWLLSPLSFPIRLGAMYLKD